MSLGTLSRPLAASSNGGGGSYGLLIVLAPLARAFYMFMIRPQPSRIRKADEQQRGVSGGSRVMTARGMCGPAAAIEDGAVRIEVALGVATRRGKGAIGAVVEREETLGLNGPPTGDGEGPDR